MSLQMRYQFEAYMACKTPSAAGVFAVTLGGTFANGDKIVVCGVETVLNATSAASGNAAATAVKTSLDNVAAIAAKYTTSVASNVLTLTEKSGYYGSAKPTASVTSSAGTVSVSVTTPAAETESYNLIGEGFTQFAESKNPQTYSRKYINHKSQSNDVIGYAPSYAYSCDCISDDPVVREITKVHDGELIGNDARRDVVFINRWDEASNGAYPAKKRTFAIIPNQKADGTDAMVYTGQIDAVTDFVEGTFNPDTGTWAAS